MAIDKAQWEAVVTHYRKTSAERAARITAARARDNVVRSGRVDTGNMADAFEVLQSGPGEFLVTNTADYYTFQERGRRGFSAKPGKVLRFRPKGSAVFVFATKVGPVSPGNFMKEALDALRPSDFLPRR